MAREVTSKHLIGSTELTVVMPIRQEFVDVRDTITYATRLRFMLRILNAIRKASRESVIAREYVGPIERLRTINEARFGILENDTRLLLGVSFDEPWEPYIRTIRDDAGPLLDAICSHCVGYTSNYRSDLGYEEFAKWVRMYQVDVDFFYSAQPTLTTDDYRYLKRLETRQRKMRDLREFDRMVPEMFLRSPIEEAEEKAKRSLYAPPKQLNRLQRGRKDRLIRQGLRAVKAMYALNAFYPVPSKDDEDDQRAFEQELERRFWIRAAQAVLKQFDSRNLVKPGSEMRKQYEKELEWFESMVEPEKYPSNDPPKPVTDDFNWIQGGILNPYPGMNYGVLVLVSFANADAGRAFLKKVKNRITTESKRATAKKPFNLALTRHGLQTLGMPEDVYKHFPREFCEGMEARAGMLGDIRENHPFHWKLPDWNWPADRLDDHDNEDDHDKNTVCKVPLATVDAVIEIQASLATERPWKENYKFDDDPVFYTFGENHPLIEDIAALEGNGVYVLSVQPMRRKFKSEPIILDGEDPNNTKKRYAKDHFGYADGISQPRPTDKPEHRDDVSYGELLRGYLNDKGDGLLPSKEWADRLMKNGSFLVIRKLRQYVDTFNEVIKKQSSIINIDEEWLKGKLVGRTTDGWPLLKSSHIQNFDFEKDKVGEKCPFQAHIRRSNPRPPSDVNAEPDEYAAVRKKVPRIMRRGFSYGPRFSTEPNDHVDRGLVFMSYSASIAEQFEIIQRWIAGGNSSGVLSTHDDPLLGVPPSHDVPRPFRFQYQTQAARCELGNEHFVELQWGMYLFVPSLRAIDDLSDGIDEESNVDEGIEIIDNLQKLEKIVSPETIMDAWKQVLEDRSARLGGVTKAVWAAIRENYDGELNTPYGLLMGSYEGVMNAFNSPDPYSVREFWFRMKDTIGEGFLGMDPSPVEITDPNASEDTKTKDTQYNAAVKAGNYATQAEPVNAEVYKITEVMSYPVARDFMRKAISQKSNKNIIDLRSVSGLVMLNLCNYYFGVPIRPTPDTIANFVFAARYIFSSPHPSDFLKKKAPVRGKIELGLVEEFVKHMRKKPDELTGVITKELFAMTDMFEDTEEGNLFLAKTIAGLSNGMIAPTMGSFLSMMYQLISNEKMWRVQQQFFCETETRDAYADIEQVLVPVILESMYSGPVPDVVHRTTTETLDFISTPNSGDDSESSGSSEKPLHAGSTVILGIESATHDPDLEVPRRFEDAEVIFGGKFCPGASTGMHACSGARMGIGILAGMLTALLESGNLKLENAPLTLSRNMEDEHAVD